MTDQVLTRGREMSITQNPINVLIQFLEEPKLLPTQRNFDLFYKMLIECLTTIKDNLDISIVYNMPCVYRAINQCQFALIAKQAYEEGER